MHAPLSWLLGGLALALLCVRSVHAQLPAFPGAEGFGSISAGGRGGDVYTVTNLSASGPGSFAYGVQNAPVQGRTIVFAVSGHIRLPSGSGGGLTIDRDRITIAGQTAPGDGICFWNNTMNVTGDDLVFRNVRWRYGYSAAGGDAVDINGSQRVIFDQCDVMFSTDENMSSFGAAPEHLTFQWSTNAWGLQSHSAGGLWKMRHATVHHSLWANNHTRNPKLIGCDVFDWVNNLIFGWDLGFNLAPETTGGTGFTYRVNIRGSTFSHGGSTSSVVYGGGTNDNGTAKFRLHMADSALDGNNNGVLDVSKSNYAMVSASSYDQVPTAWPQTTNGDPAGAVVGVPVSVSPRLNAYKRILSRTGAVRMEIGPRPLRDEITALCVSRAAALQRGIISNPLELGLSTGTAFASLTSSLAPTDTDLDGMPDDWETAVGYHPAAADHNVVLSAPEVAASFFPVGSPTGYTRLEEYLHFKAVAHGTVARSVSSSPSFIDIDLRKFTSGFTASPVFTLSEIAGGTAIQSGPGGALIRFSPLLDYSGRAGFLYTVTDAAGDSWTQQCALVVSTRSLPRPITWVGDGVTNAWDGSTANFSSALGRVTFAANDAVTIDDTGSNSPTIKVTGSLAPASLAVANSAKTFTLAGTGSLTSTGSFTKSGSGSLTLSNTGPNSFPTAALEAGTLTLSASGAVGSAPIRLSGGTLAATVDFSNSMVLAGEASVSPSGNRTLNGALSGSGTLRINNSGSNLLTLGGSMSAFSGAVTFASSTGSVRLYGNAGSATTAFDLGTGGVTLFSRNGGSFQLGALAGGPNTVLSGTSSTTTASTYTIGGLGTSTTFSGRITNGGQAPTALTKSGTGTLTLTGNSSYTGTTSVSAGALEVNGSLGTTPVLLASGATLSGAGSLSGAVTAAAGAILSPGSANAVSPGTLTVGSLALTTPTLRFDLSSSPAGASDRLVSSGAITLAGSQSFQFNLVDGVLSPGVYELISTPAALTANSVSFSSNLPSGTRQAFWFTRNASGAAPGFVRLNVSGAPANLTWTGIGDFWDRENTAAWSGAAPATFYNADHVTFDDSATTGSVTITQPVAPRSITVNNTSALPYTIGGGPIVGEGFLVKSGSGTLTLLVPQYTLANCTLTAGYASITVPSTAQLVPGMTVSGNGIPNGTIIVAIPDAATLTLSATATVSSTTTTLTFETRNTFSGGTFLNDGILQLASNAAPTSAPTAPANPFGLGTGPITFNGGTLILQGHVGANLSAQFGALPNALIVPDGQTGNLFSTVRGINSVPFAALTGPLTGSGTLNLTTNYFRSSITGDWSAFSGTINVKRPASGASSPRFQIAAETGFPLATVNLDQTQLEYTAVPPPEGAVVSFGSLSGIATSIISGSQNAVGPVTWRVGLLNTSTTFAGSFTPFVSGGPIGLAKAGTGTWTLTGSGNVSAGITVEAGTLSYGDGPSDALTGSSAIVVNSGATLQLNQGARLAGTSCEVFSAGSLRGHGTLEAPLDSFGVLSAIGGTLSVIGNAHLSGELSFASWTDRLAVTGDLDISGILTLPSSEVPAAGRHLLATCTGTLTAEELTLTGVPPGFDATLDLAVQGELAVILTSRWTYADWQADRFADPGIADAGPNEDPDFDGLPNLLEYMLEGSPTAPDHARLPTATVIADTFVFSFIRRASTSRHSTQTFEYSTDLSSWTSVPLQAPHAELGPITNDLQTVIVRVPGPAQPNGRLMGRLRITLP